MTRLSDREWNATPIPRRVQERAGTRWESDGDCWISTYSTASHGYAQIGWQNSRERHVVLAHRASWEYAMGPVPLGHTLDHLCKQKRCVNPAHLRRRRKNKAPLPDLRPNIPDALLREAKGCLMAFKTKPRGDQLSFLTECHRCRAELTISNGRVERHDCEPSRPISLADLRAALDNRTN